MAGVNSNELLPLSGFPGGINNRAPEEAVPAGALRAARNVDLDDAGKLRRRPGATEVYGVPGLHSLWAHDRVQWLLGVDPTSGIIGFDVYEDREALGPTLQRPDLPMSWDYAAGRVFASNGVDALELREDGTTQGWATEAPGGQPLASVLASAGGLDAGIYQVAVTFIDVDGRESGATLPVEVELQAGQGIQLTNFPVSTDPRTALVRVYCSAPNGETLFAAQDLPVGLPSFLLGAHTPGAQLDKLFLSTMPPCTIVRAGHGRLWGARGPLLLWSEALMYGLTRGATNYARHDGDVTMIEMVGQGESSGLYVSTAAGAGKRAGRTYYLTSPDPANWQRVVAHHEGAVPGSATQLPARELGFEVPGLVPVWLTGGGQLVAGLPGGQVVELHAANYVAPAGVEHASLALREVGGMRHLIATLRGGQASGLTAVDQAEAEVWKNGARIA